MNKPLKTRKGKRFAAFAYWVNLTRARVSKETAFKVAQSMALASLARRAFVD